MTKTLAAVAVLAAAGASNAAFDIVSVDFGNSATANPNANVAFTGVAVSSSLQGGTFASDLANNPGFAGNNGQGLEAGSWITLGSADGGLAGPVDGDPNTPLNVLNNNSGVALSEGTGVTAGGINGFINFNQSSGVSATQTASADPNVLAEATIARIAFETGSGGIDMSNLAVVVGLSNSTFGTNGEADPTINAVIADAAGSNVNIGIGATVAELNFFYRLSVRSLGTFTVGDGSFNPLNDRDVDVFDIVVEQVIPTPGAMALLGVAGLAGARRRR